MNNTMVGVENVVQPRANGNPDFNYEFLIFAGLGSALAAFFLLYFNRLFASIASYALRTWTWHRYRIYLDIRAIQISLLGGRIFFTGLRYHGANETFVVQHGYITWRYWLRRVRNADILDSRNPESDSSAEPTADGKDKNAQLPSRIHVNLIGLEWFVYNRSPAYDSILASLSEATDPASRTSGSEVQDGTTLRPRGSGRPEYPEHGPLGQNKNGRPVDNKGVSEKLGLGDRPGFPHRRTTTGFGSADEDERNNPGPSLDLPFMLQLFPIRIECQKAALVAGNENTKAILVAKVESLSTDVDATETTTSDPYRQLFKVQFKHPVIEMRENEDFKEDQAARAAREQDIAQGEEPVPKRFFFRHHRRKALSSLRNLVPYWRRSVESFSTDSRTAINTAASQIPGNNQWQGLTRYLDDRDQDDRARWVSVEYAAVSTILDSPEASLTVYWDAVGKVADHGGRQKDTSFPRNINGDEPPAWGINVSVKGGTMNYGPWADRQRADLQRFFFPSLCKDATPAQPLQPGAWRTPVQFKLYVEIEDTVTLRIPIREESKNWRWRGKEPHMRHQKAPTKRKERARAKKNNQAETTQLRPAGWLELKVPSNSTVTFTMDMLAHAAGYNTLLDVDLPSTELWSSVNHDLLWRSGAQRITCDLSNPISWNALRNWHFNIVSDKLELFILRDHIFLLVDLVDDWTNGPPPEYLVFIPFKYHLNLTLQSVKLYLNVNDANIIDKATALEDNACLILSSPCLTAETCINLESFRPSKNAIPFDVRADSMDLTLQVPQWNTQAAFLNSKELAHIESLVIDGGYHYNATTSTTNTDSLVLNVRGQSPWIYLYGFVIRYVMLLKDNYFGEYVHFRTLDEYQEQLQLKARNPDAEATNKPPHKKSNDLDVILSIKIDDTRVMLPGNLYSSERYIQGELASVSLDLRFTNYYMDMEIELSPVSLSLGSSEGALDSPGMSSSNTQLFIDGLRIYGHRLFGLPPSEPTYLCNWDVSVGAVTGECTTDFLVTLGRGGAAFAFSFDDVENALVPYSALVFYDVTFARVNVHSVRLWLHVEEAAFLLSTDAIDVEFNDWARSHYSKRANIKVPNIQVSCVNAESAARQKSKHQHPVETEAYLRTAIHLAVIGRKFHFSEERKLQQELVQREDQRTHRTEFLLFPEYLDEFIPEQVDPPAQCAPPPPHPALAVDDEDEEASYRSFTSNRSRNLSHKSSFLSFSGTSNSSVVRPHSRLRSMHKSQQDEITSPRSTPADSNNLAVKRRKFSTSTGHLSVGDHTAKDNQIHSSVAFSSQYVAPHFPLEGVRPNTQDAPFQSTEWTYEDDVFERTEAELDDIDPNNLSEEHAYSSTLVEFPSGISAFATPTSIRYMASLLDSLHPTEPEELLDSFQIDAMTRIFDLQKERDTHGQIKDFFIRVPSANFRVLNSTAADSTDSSQEEQDQYDLMLSKVALVTRTTTNWDDPFKRDSWDSKTSLHLRVGSAEISASERLSSLQEPQAALMAQIENVMVSVGAKEVRYFDADIGSIVGSTSSGKIEYLASLIHRTGTIAADLGELLTDTITKHQARHKYFTYRLLEEGQLTNDPSFLIRPSAVLRSANSHLRTFDSWKLAMRLRQIWTTMDLQTRAQLLQQCWDGSPVAPVNAVEVVMAAFQKWRSWDLQSLSDSVLLKNIFGRIKEAIPEPENEIPLLGACRLSEVQFVLDPGPKQNKIGFVDMAARIDQQISAFNGDFKNATTAKGPLTIVNMYCAEAAINLNWELCELAEDISRLYNRNRTQPEPSPSLTTIPKKPTPMNWPEMHVVLEVTRGSIEFETINLNSKTLSDGLKASLLLNGGGDCPSSVNFMLNCNAVTSRLHSHSHVLGISQFREPSFILSHELQETTEASCHTIKSTASSQSLTFAVKEDPIGLMEILDLLFRDEVAQLYRLKSQLITSPQPKERRKSVRISDRLSSYKVNLAMFLDEYSITIPLLQSLTYKITGTVARAATAANFGKEVIFDFDIKENYHEMQINVRNEPRSISLLQIPPTNGRITSHMTQTEHLVTVLSSLEVVQLDASAVYSLLTALNKPQISSAIQELQQQITIIRGHVDDIFGTDGTDADVAHIEATQPSLKLVYNVHMTLAGLQVSAKTSLKSDIEPIARILFSLDRAHLQASNRHETHGPISKFPEIHLNLTHIELDIRRGSEDSMRSCGKLGLGVTVSASSRLTEDGKEDWSFDFRSDDFEVILAPETISTVIDVLGYLGEKIKDLDTSRELDYLRKLRQSKPRITINDNEDPPEDADIIDSVLASVKYQFELRNIRVCWIVADGSDSQSTNKEDLVLSVKLFEFGTRTRRSARLTIENFQVQMVPPGQDKNLRSLHSALLPEVTFNIAYISTASGRRMAFQAVGESLDLRLTSAFILPAAHLVESISLSTKNVQQASTQWNTGAAVAKKPDGERKAEPQRSIFGNKRMESLLVDADFAGAVVYVSSKRTLDDFSGARYGRPSLAGKYGQFNNDDSGSGAVLRSPGLAWKVEYRDNAQDDPSLYGEIKIDASSNILYPSVVPLVMDILSNVKEVVKDDDDTEPTKKPVPPKAKSEKSGEEDNILTADPSAVLGRLKLNLGLRICKQEFSLSCQPIARVAATTCFDNIYFTINTVHSLEQGNFFAISGAFTKLHASVQHVYSRESTASFEIDSITLSLMNSKHVSGISGVSAILKVSPMAVSVNAKQAQDFLLFREIWYPSELRRAPAAPVAKLATETSQGHLVQRYQQVAATAAFPWTATISIEALDVTIDLGQSIGKSAFAINNFWVSSKKTSDWEQNLFLGFDKIGIDCTGRLSGFIALQDFRLRTSIHWPKREEALNETPLIQASIGFNALRVKAAFDYQAFLVADITSLEFLMYNVRESHDGSGDRLVAICDGDAVQIFGTTTSAAQGIALWQAIQKLMQERRESFETSLKEIERFMKRRSVSRTPQDVPPRKLPKEDTLSKSPISLDTDVVVTLKALNFGLFPSTFSDHQVFKVEATDAYARFAAGMENRRIHSILRMMLGQLRIGLAGVRNVEAPKALSEISVEDVIQRATGSRGGTILKVPQVSAVMETWQTPLANQIDYIFKSAFEGKVEVGWNYSRVSYIRGMWANHAKSLEHVWGKELPLTAVKITGVPQTEAEQRKGEQQKITAEVNVPQSKYDYVALEAPIIETPQLRDMGEATPPLEWIGLHRDRLPNLTHQIVIVSLLELAGEVEDAYSRILGSS
ncbi:hypothetical protein G7046_g8533 [Stylonectria norvegica]|nr:hypothetical protein G7046_g8533 [Stylonectria norvegica]